MSFRDNLLHLRAAHNMTQEQLAMLLGVSRQSVTKWEAEKSYPEMDKLLKLCQIFDCTLDELVQGDMTDRDVAQPAAASYGTPADLFGYDELMRRFANKIAFGVAAPIAFVALAICFFALGDSSNPGFSPLPENVAAALGILCLFIGTAICLGLIIPAGIRHGSFVKEHPYIEDFYTKEQKASAHRRFTIELIAGILCICLGICSIILFVDSPFEGVLGTPLLMLFIAVGVCLIVHGALTFSRVDIEDYNEEAGEHLSRASIDASDLPDEEKAALLKKRAVDKRRGALCGIIMIIATIVAFTMLFAYGNGSFWLAWVIGGLLCGITSLAFQAAGKD